ncbi:hypothetical protein CFOL_v3_01853, partial [Cephalotus follicularis]
MTSSMLTGDRRWTSGRRGGMTVLGKVAAPKPINLPSQKLENHGLDPSVEIVPKGTLSWGSRSSSSATNAWGSSTQSPNADGGSNSPSYLSGRPSSGGSGTRPSTSGSDRAHELNAWGSNSRPSSASGARTSNQMSHTSLRPRSAETRPGSSQLSRFAEPLSENSVAWGGAVTTENSGMASSKDNGFSLTSGDFPTLGSEKENFNYTTDSQDHGYHGRPGSSSSRVAQDSTGSPLRVDASANSNIKGGTSDSWGRDYPQYGEEGFRPNVEKWQADPQPYLNASIPPQHYDAWHGPPINNHPGGSWYRGPPGGPPYGPPVPPGGFPMEPFPYYHPLANSQPVPPPGTGPRGPLQKNGDLYRPHMPDAYIRPGMPIRPGFYPGPVAYEGYYGPPMGYCNPNERDIPFMGRPAGPSAFNRYPGQNAPDLGNSHARSSGYEPTGKPFVSEQVEPGHPHDTQGPYKVLLKQHDGWEGKDEQQNWEDRLTSNVPYIEKVDKPRMSRWDNDRRTDRKKDDEMVLRRKALGEDAVSQTLDHREGGSSVPIKVKSPKISGNVKFSEDILVKKSENSVSSFPELPGALRDSNLIQKIESLNAKARAADELHDVISISHREEQNNKTQVVNAWANDSETEAASGSAYPEISHGSGIANPASHKVSIASGDKSMESTGMSGMAISRRSTHGMHVRADHRNKGRLNTQDVDGWRKKYPVADSSDGLSASHSENSSNVHLQNQKPLDVAGPYPLGKDEEDSVPPMFDPIDSQAQMTELAKQRMKQRQKEEEERTREQKAKALAKLEELNRRAQTFEASNQNQAHSEPSITHKISVLFQQEVNNADAAQRNSASQVDDGSSDTAQHNTASQVHDSSNYKHKSTGFKQKQKTLDKSTSSPTTEAPKSRIDVVGSFITSQQVVANESASSCDCESSLPDNPDIVAEPPAPQRRKNNRSSKNKHKVDEASSSAALPSVASKETNHLNTSVENLGPSFIQPLTDLKDASRLSEQPSSLVNEEGHGRVNNQWKSQHTRRMSRNSQGNRSVEKFHGDAVVWAPVRTQNRSEIIEEASQKSNVEDVAPLVKSEHQVQNTPRNKRAEMERYIPKPVAKEMAQQGSIQQPVASSVNQTSDETVVKVDSGSQGIESSAPESNFVKVGSVVEFRNGDGKQNKQGKGPGSWRQRGSESTTMQGLQDMPPSRPSRNVQKSVDHSHPQKPEVSLAKEQPMCYDDEWNASDSWITPNSSKSAAPVLEPVVKDQGGTGKGKRHASKGHKGAGSNQNFERKKIYSVDSDKVSSQTAVPEMSQADLPTGSRENRGGVDRSSSHWQPKSQASAYNQRGSRSNGGQNVDTKVGRPDKRDSTPQGGAPLPPQLNKETTEGLAEPHHTQSVSGKSIVKAAPNVVHQEAKRERRIASLKGPFHSSNHGLGRPVEQDPLSNVDIRQDHHPPLGFHKNGNQSSRYRGQDYRGDKSSSGHDNKQQNTSANREWQRPNPHFEYQPVGLQNNSRANITEGSKDGSHNSGSRFREKAQSHSMHGGGTFHERQSGSVRVD